MIPIIRTIMSPFPCLDLDACAACWDWSCSSFVLAAQRLARSTSAVSAQLKKLEQQCGTGLVMKQGDAIWCRRGQR